MILKEQSVLITTMLNDIIDDLYLDDADPAYDIQFYITDTYQEFQPSFTIDDKNYIPGILRRLDPFVPKSPAGIINDYLEIELYVPFEHRDTVEVILNEYQDRYHAKYQSFGGNIFTQYIGKAIADEIERSIEGDLVRYQKIYLRVEWDTILDGISYDQTSISIGGTVFPVKIQTYRNDKSTIANKPYNDAGNTNINLVSEELVVTIPLTTATATSQLWQDIHSRVYNKTYTIVDNYGAGGTMTKTWELKSGIVNKEENKIVSFTCVFDIPLPRATVTITHKPVMGSSTTGQVILLNFNAGGANSLDARMKVDLDSNERIVKANELRQGSSYNLSFVYEPDNDIAKILAVRTNKKVNGDRFDITYTFEDLTFTYENLVLESGSHAWNDNPGLAFTCNFAEGL